MLSYSGPAETIRTRHFSAYSGPAGTSRTRCSPTVDQQGPVGPDVLLQWNSMDQQDQTFSYSGPAGTSRTIFSPAVDQQGPVGLVVFDRNQISSTNLWAFQVGCLSVFSILTHFTGPPTNTHSHTNTLTHTAHPLHCTHTHIIIIIMSMIIIIIRITCYIQSYIQQDTALPVSLPLTNQSCSPESDWPRWAEQQEVSLIGSCTHRKSLSWNTLRSRKGKGQENGLLRKPKDTPPPLPPSPQGDKVSSYVYTQAIPARRLV